MSTIIERKDYIGMALFVVWLWVTVNWLADLANSPYQFAQKCVSGPIISKCSITPQNLADIFTKVVQNPMANPMLAILIPLVLIGLLYSFIMMMLQAAVPEEGEEPVAIDTSVLGGLKGAGRFIQAERTRRAEEKFKKGQVTKIVGEDVSRLSQRIKEHQRFEGLGAETSRRLRAEKELFEAKGAEKSRQLRGEQAYFEGRGIEASRRFRREALSKAVSAGPFKRTTVAEKARKRIRELPGIPKMSKKKQREIAERDLSE